MVALIGDTGLEGLEAARDALQDDAWIELASRSSCGRPTAADPALRDRAPARRPHLHRPGLRRAARSTTTRPSARRCCRTTASNAPSSAPVPTSSRRPADAGPGDRGRGGGERPVQAHRWAAPRAARPRGRASTTMGSSTRWRPRRSPSPAPEVDHLVEVLDSDDVATVLSALDTPTSDACADQFCSFGSCSVDEPFDELVRLGLAGGVT